jgi:hypothetical protein
MEKGGEREGIIRMVMALRDDGRAIDPEDLLKEMKVFCTCSGKKRPSRTLVRDMIREQAHLLKMDERLALKALTRLIPTIEGRKRALDLVSRTIISKKPLSERQKMTLARLRKILGLQFIHLERFKPPNMHEQQIISRKKIGRLL